MKKIFGILLNYFVKGLLIVMPLGCVIFLIYWAVSRIDNALNLSNILITDSKGKGIYIPGLGILNVLLIILVAGEEKKFNEPVLVDVNEFGLKKIGFVVKKDLSAINLPGEVAVYFPLSYSFAGQVVIISADKVHPIDKSAAEVMKFVISGGVSGLD